jgi:aminoglycoside phosphotransferase family enzyme/predicted kinase
VELIEVLSDPAVYPHPVERVEVIQTHISVVFLAGPFAYKLKKPIQTGYLDFRTLEQRLHFCRQEIRLNRRLAPAVYLDVVPVAEQSGRLKVEGPGVPVEWLVKMVRLPADATLRARLMRDEVTPATLEVLARRIGDFHAAAPPAGADSPWGLFDLVAGNVRATLPGEPDESIRPAVRARLAAAIEANLERFRPLIEARAERGLPRDTHGDIRLDHVYLFPERNPPEDIVVVDCIEFNDRFRLADPLADVAFLVMELTEAGRADLAGVFRDAYLDAFRDSDGGALVPFYTGYRAAVRAEVESMRGRDAGVPVEERHASRNRARGLWLLALGQLEPPGSRPCLILTAGLPGTGKSTLARALAEQAHLHALRSDVVRKELAGSTPRHELYTPEWNERTYGECRRRAAEILAEGGRVLIDANFREEWRRQAFAELARSWGVHLVLLLCQARPETVRRRLTKRVGDASDADWAVYQQAARTWEEPGPLTRRLIRNIDGEADPAAMLEQGLAALRQAGVLEGSA